MISPSCRGEVRMERYWLTACTEEEIKSYVQVLDEVLSELKH